MAPQQRGRPREVLIAISNYNLVLSGQLPLWLQVPPCPFTLPPGSASVELLRDVHAASMSILRGCNTT